MCLDTGNRITNEQETKGFGYKGIYCVKNKHGYEHLPVSLNGGGVKFKVSGWNTDRAKGYLRYYYRENTRRLYPKGFHISLTRDGARGMGGRIARVEYKEAHTLGTQDGVKVVVARKFRIIGWTR